MIYTPQKNRRVTYITSYNFFETANNFQTKCENENLDFLA